MPWLGIELGAHLLNQDAHFVWDTDTVWGMDDEESTNLLFTLGPNFHLTPDRKVDVYLGPFLAYASRDDLNFSDQGFSYSYGLDDETAFGAQLGLDVPVCAKGRCWTFTSAVKWLDLDNDVEFENGPVGALPQDFSLDFSPLFVTVGAGYRF